MISNGFSINQIQMAVEIQSRERVRKETDMIKTNENFS